MNILFYFILVTRDPVPKQILKMWHPSVSSQRGSTSKQDSDCEDTSFDDTEDESSIPISGLLDFPSMPPLSQRHRNKSEEIISISGKKLISTYNLTI